MNIKKADAWIYAFIILLVGIILGQAWAFAQKQNRDENCRKYGIYCDECVKPLSEGR